MTQSVHSTPPVLAYASSRRSELQRRADRVLLMWVILNALAIPFGLLVGGGGVVGMLFAIFNRDSLSEESIEDFIAVILWWINSPGLLVGPALWIWFCGRCRDQVMVGDSRIGVLGPRLCWWAMAGGAVFGAGMLYGLGKAVCHGRWAEVPWWMGMLALVAGYGVGVEYTRRVLRAVGREFEIGMRNARAIA